MAASVKAGRGPVESCMGPPCQKVQTIVCAGDEEMEEVVEHTADGQAAT